MRLHSNHLVQALCLTLFACAASLGVPLRQAAASTVTIVELFPDTSTTIHGPIGPFTLGSAALPTASDPFSISRPWTFDVTNTQIIFNPNENQTYAGGIGFNGFEFIFSGGFPAITNVTSDASSTLIPV